MRNAFAVLAVAVVSASGCGNTAVDIGGRRFEVQSAEMMQIYGMPFVYLTDIPDFCAKMRAAYANTNSCNTTSSTGSTSAFSSLYGSYLMIAAYGAYDGARLNIVQNTANPYATAAGAQVTFATSSASAGGYAYSAAATTGTVSIEQFRNSDHIAGTYDITLNTGEREQGHFQARYCNAMESAYLAAQNTRSCSESSLSTSYSRSCSCGGQSVSASCTRPSTTSNTWTCSCSRGSTCTMGSAPVEGSDTGTCCSLQL